MQAALFLEQFLGHYWDYLLPIQNPHLTARNLNLFRLEHIEVSAIAFTLV
jgi:hypothetical protein